MPETPQDLIGAAEASRILDVDKATLTRWVKGGRVALAGRLSGGALIFDRPEIERLRDDREAKRAEAVSA